MNINPSEIHYEILQTSKRGVAFFGLESTTVNIKEDEYIKEFEGKHFKTSTRNDKQVLDDIYQLHNRDDRPARETMRSLSMSDIVVIEGRAYACQNFGWKRVWLKED
jgi:hypothetical protein